MSDSVTEHWLIEIYEQAKIQTRILEQIHAILEKQN